MKATDLDVDITCKVCNGDGTEPAERQVWGYCPRCGGDGVINRYQDRVDREDAESGVVYQEMVIAEGFEDHGTHAVFEQQSMPEEHPEWGGFNGLFGDFVPPGLDVSNQNRPQAEIDRLQDTSNPAPLDALTWAQSNGLDGYAELLSMWVAELGLSE